MFPSPFKWFNHLTASTYAARAAEPYREFYAREIADPSETPLFDATVLATGVNPEPYEMDGPNQIEHSACVTNDMTHTMSRLAVPLYAAEASR